MTLPDIEEAFPLGWPRPQPAHSGAFATVVAVMDQSKIPIKSWNIISVIAMIWVPESPRYLVSVGRLEEAAKAF